MTIFGELKPVAVASSRDWFTRWMAAQRMEVKFDFHTTEGETMAARDTLYAGDQCIEVRTMPENVSRIANRRNKSEHVKLDPEQRAKLLAAIRAAILAFLAALSGGAAAKGEGGAHELKT